MTLATKELEVHWANIAPWLSIRNEREYNAAVKRLNELLDEIGDNEKHPPHACYSFSLCDRFYFYYRGRISPKG